MTTNISCIRLVSDDEPALAAGVEVCSLTGSEQLGRPYELAVELVSRGRPLDCAQLLELPLCLELLAPGGEAGGLSCLLALAAAAVKAVKAVKAVDRSALPSWPVSPLFPGRGRARHSPAVMRLRVAVGTQSS